MGVYHYNPDQLKAEIDLNQGYHPPADNAIAEHLSETRQEFIAFCHRLVDRTPANEHLKRALALLDEAQMYVIKAQVTDQDELADILMHLSLDGS